MLDYNEIYRDDVYEVAINSLKKLQRSKNVDPEISQYVDYINAFEGILFDIYVDEEDDYLEIDMSIFYKTSPIIPEFVLEYVDEWITYDVEKFLRQEILED